MISYKLRKIYNSAIIQSYRKQFQTLLDFQKFLRQHAESLKKNPNLYAINRCEQNLHGVTLNLAKCG